MLILTLPIAVWLSADTEEFLSLKLAPLLLLGIWLLRGGALFPRHCRGQIKQMRADLLCGGT